MLPIHLLSLRFEPSFFSLLHDIRAGTCKHLSSASWHNVTLCHVEGLGETLQEINQQEGTYLLGYGSFLYFYSKQVLTLGSTHL